MAEVQDGMRRESLLKDDGASDDGSDHNPDTQKKREAAPALAVSTRPSAKQIDVDAPAPEPSTPSSAANSLFVSLRALRDGARDFLPGHKAAKAEAAHQDQSLLAAPAKPVAEATSPLTGRKKVPSGIPPREHTGWLWHRSGMIPQWKRRWFAVRISPTTTLDLEELVRQKKKLPKWAYDEILGSFNAGAGLLFCYKTDAATPEVLKNAVNLRGSDGVERLPVNTSSSNSKHPYHFQVHTVSEGPYVVAAETEEEMEAWVRELTAVTDHIRTILLLLSKSTSSSRDNLVWI